MVMKATWSATYCLLSGDVGGEAASRRSTAHGQYLHTSSTERTCSEEKANKLWRR